MFTRTRQIDLHLRREIRRIFTSGNPTRNPRIACLQGALSSTRVSSLARPHNHQNAVVFSRLESSQARLAQAADSSSRMSEASLSSHDRMLEVTWGSGTVDRFPYVWLRDNCQCDQCCSAATKTRLFLLEQLDVTIEPQSVEVGISRHSPQGGHSRS